jgi:predicted DNA-binding transcriptional regulator AlpA
MERIVRRAEAAEILGMSKKTLDRLKRSDPEFPPEVRLSERVSGFLAGDIEAFVLRRAGRPQPEAA